MDYKTMSGPQLVAAYNELVAKADKRGQNTFKNVKRFASVSAGVKRIEELRKFLGEAKSKKAAKPSNKENIQGFIVSKGSNREKAIKHLLKSVGEPVKVTSLLSPVYGSSDLANRGSLSFVLKGVDAIINDHKLPFELRRSKEGKEVYVGLFRKS